MFCANKGWKAHQWTDADIGGQEYKPIDADFCKSWIEHSIKKLEEWILKSGPKGSQYHPLDFQIRPERAAFEVKALCIPTKKEYLL